MNPEKENLADATQNDRSVTLTASPLPDDDEANAAGLPQTPDSVVAFDEDGREDR